MTITWHTSLDAGQILFYSLLIPVVLCGAGVVPAGALSVYDWLNYVLPVETEHYWFATAYPLSST